MPNTGPIQTLIDSFVADLDLHMRRSALEQVLAALQGELSMPARRGRKPGRKPGRPAGSRSGNAVDADRLLSHVKANPGQRGEQIAQALGTDVKRLRPVMLKLIAAKSIRTTGQRRGMQYFAGAAAPRTPVKRSKKRGKKATRSAKRRTTTRRKKSAKRVAKRVAKRPAKRAPKRAAKAEVVAAAPDVKAA